MIPILFESNETEFNTNGLGRLSDAISMRVSEELNGIYELEMEYPTNGRHYLELTEGRYIYAQPAANRSPQAFEIYDSNKGMSGSTVFYAHHISYRLSRVPVLPISSKERTPSQVWATMIESQTETHPFTFFTDIGTAKEYSTSIPISFRNVLGGQEGSMLDLWHGDYEWDMFQVKYLSRRGTDRGYSIEYGKNLLDIKQERNIENTVTGFTPYWHGTDNSQNEITVLGLPPYVVQSEYASKYPYHRTLPLDVTEILGTEEVPTNQQVTDACSQYIKDNSIGLPKVSLTVDFVHLPNTEEFKNVLHMQNANLGDTVHVKFAKLGIEVSARIKKTVWDVLNDRYEELSIGDTTAGISETIAANEATMQQNTQNTQSMLRQEVERATRMVTGNGEAGTVLWRRRDDGTPYELDICDTDNIYSALNVWRFNKAGLGHSSTGYNGEMNVALTADGHINADMITAGVLQGVNIEGVNITGVNIEGSTISGTKITSKSNDNNKRVEMDNGKFRSFNNRGDKGFELYGQLLDIYSFGTKDHIIGKFGAFEAGDYRIIGTYSHHDDSVSLGRYFHDYKNNIDKGVSVFESSPDGNITIRMVSGDTDDYEKVTRKTLMYTKGGRLFMYNGKSYGPPCVSVGISGGDGQHNIALAWNAGRLAVFVDDSFVGYVNLSAS